MNLAPESPPFLNLIFADRSFDKVFGLTGVEEDDPECANCGTAIPDGELLADSNGIAWVQAFITPYRSPRVAVDVGVVSQHFENCAQEVDIADGSQVLNHAERR